MRDKRFVAKHRSGPLSRAHHRQLTTWACACTKHVLPLFGKKPETRILNALNTAKNWSQGIVPVGDAQKAAWAVHALARELSNPAAVAVARSAGHAVATAHMADHSLGAAWYALKAVKSAGTSVEVERKWQDKQLPPGIKKLVLTARKRRKI
jgi:hypothetical protein